MGRIPRSAKRGTIFNRLTLLDDVVSHVGEKARCKCICGKEVYISVHNLLSNATKSCGCLNKEHIIKMQQDGITHGHSSKRGKRKPSLTYKSWRAMRERVLNKKSKDYERWGGRGIKICERWNKFENFLADMGDRPIGTSLNRKDNNGDYTPGNCDWATLTEQNRNRRMSIRKPGVSGYRGVYSSNKSGVWRVQLRAANKLYFFGYFTDPIEAARKYDKEAKILHGSLARLNFV